MSALSPAQDKHKNLPSAVSKFITSTACVNGASPHKAQLYVSAQSAQSSSGSSTNLYAHPLQRGLPVEQVALEHDSIPS